MAIDEADQSDAGQFEGVDDDPGGEASTGGTPTSGSDVRVGQYTWREFMEEYGYESQVSDLYENVRRRQQQRQEEELGLESSDEVPTPVPEGDDWGAVDFDPVEYLGFHPDALSDLLRDPIVPNANVLREEFLEYVDPDTTPVVKDRWTWEHFKWEYYYDEDGNRPRKGDGSIDRFDAEEYLGFDPDHTENELSRAEDVATELRDVVDERTVDVNEEIDEDGFFSTADGHTTVTNRYDLEKAVSLEKKQYFTEKERYWVNKPYSFVIIFQSEKENEVKYYAVEPYLNEIEDGLREFLTGKLRNAIKYSDENLTVDDDEESRRGVIERETRKLLQRYDLFDKPSASGTSKGIVQQFREMLGGESAGESDSDGGLDGIEVRPEPAIMEEDPETLNEYQVEKLLYQLKRNFIGYERIDPIKHDINVEDISCNGYHSPVFVYHGEYEQVITNVYHGEDELDEFVVKMAQRSGKGISKRRPQVDATLPDGSRAQLTLGKEVSDHGTNYTIRQFQDVPHTPIDLINWNTFSLDEMTFLWLCIENNKSLIFAGGTASGKTTSLNAVSLFIPSSSKVVSIEDTREVELPQRNWIASVTRQSFTDDSGGGVDEFDLLEAALRQRPEYIVMGEVRGEEGRDLFQVMSTGHTSYSTFHADTVGEVLKRFTTDPINVSKTMFTALDLVSIQTQTRVGGRKVRRNKKLTEVNHYDAETDEINVQDVYQWQAETDEFLMMGDSNTLEEIKFDRGWNQEKLERELFKRRTIIAYLIKNGLSEYTEVAATVQAFINDPETILALIANGQLEESLEDLRQMESIVLDIDPEKEELVPRPDPPDEVYNKATDILERAEESLFDEFRGQVPAGIASALSGVEQAEDPEIDPEEADDPDFGGAFEEEVEDGFDVDPGEEFGFSAATGEEEVANEGPDWLSDEGGFDFGEDEGSAAADDDAGVKEQPTAAADAAATETTESPDPPATTDDDGPTVDPEAAGSTTDTAEATPNSGAAADPSAAGATDDRPELESGEAAADPGGDGDPIFSEPEDGAGEDLFDDGDSFFDGEDFDEDDDTASIFTEEDTVSSGGSGGMFGASDDETGEDLLEEAGDLFGGGPDEADGEDDATDAGSTDSTADEDPVADAADANAPSGDAVADETDRAAAEADPDEPAETTDEPEVSIEVDRPDPSEAEGADDDDGEDGSGLGTDPDDPDPDSDLDDPDLDDEGPEDGGVFDGEDGDAGDEDDTAAGDDAGTVPADDGPFDGSDDVEANEENDEESEGGEEIEPPAEADEGDVDEAGVDEANIDEPEPNESEADVAEDSAEDEESVFGDPDEDDESGDGGGIFSDDADDEDGGEDDGGIFGSGGGDEE